MIKDFSMRGIWNDAALRPDREAKKRDYLWASMLSRPLVDNYLSMMGVEPSNPPNMRSRRKFLAGNLIEEIQGIIVNCLGLKTDKQEEVWTRGVIDVKGKLDFLIQGKPDYFGARKKINKLGFSKETIDYLLSVVDKFEITIGNNEFAPMIRECKSCSQYVIEKIGKGGEIIGHKLQLYHYLKGMNLPLGYVDYISKDNMLMEECLVEYPDKRLEDIYNNYLTDLKKYLDANERPPLESLIAWEGKFSKNFGIEYSGYLTMLYGFETPEAYREVVSGKIARWNRVLLRVKNNDKMTKKNEEVIKEMEISGYNVQELAGKLEGVIEEEVEIKE